MFCADAARAYASPVSVAQVFVHRPPRTVKFLVRSRCIQPWRYRHEPHVGIAVVPEFEALQIFASLLGRPRERHPHGAVAAEIQSAMIRSKVRLVVGTGAVLLVSLIANRCDRSPFGTFSQNNIKMVLGIVLAPSRTAEHQERTVRRDFRINVGSRAVAEGKRLGLLIDSVLECRRIRPLAAFRVY